MILTNDLCSAVVADPEQSLVTTATFQVSVSLLGSALLKHLSLKIKDDHSYSAPELQTALFYLHQHRVKNAYIVLHLSHN